MAHWKRLTRNSDGVPIDVNMENVAYLVRYNDATQIGFPAFQGEHRIVVAVKETPDEIHGMLKVFSG